MKRLLRWILIVFLLIVVLSGAAGYLVRLRMMARPIWYAQRLLDPQTSRAAANSLDQKLIETFSAARRAAAAEARRQHEASVAKPVFDDPNQLITFSATEEELNAFFDKWKADAGLDGDFGGHLTDPVILLEDNRLTLAGTVKLKQMDVVLSLRFVPRLEDGKLNLGFEKVMAGMLPVPRSYFARYITRLSSMVEAQLPEERKHADINPRGWANGAAVDVAMGELLVRALHDQPAEPVLFLPEPGASGGRTLPVKIVGVEIHQKTLTLKVKPMTPAERAELLKHLRGG